VDARNWRKTNELWLMQTKMGGFAAGFQMNVLLVGNKKQFQLVIFCS